MDASESSIPKKYLIQVREYPLKKGCRTRSIVVEDRSLLRAHLRIETLYDQLDKYGEARVIFKR